MTRKAGEDTGSDDVIATNVPASVDRRKRPSEVSAASSSSSSSSSGSSSFENNVTTTTTMRGGGGGYDDTGSSRLFQPHRTIGLLTASSPNNNNNKDRLMRSSSSTIAGSDDMLFRSQRGKFHLQPQSTSSDESFVTVPLGDRFQIMGLGKLAPVLVSRSLPPSAAHHRGGGRKKGGGSKNYEGGGDEEEMHRAVSDSSLSITVATHGPKAAGRAVSVTLFSRTRPLVCLDAFPFLKDESRRRSRRKGKEKDDDDAAGHWGIVDTVPLGKQRVAMGGEKEGRMENALLFAFVCARSDRRGDSADVGDEKDMEGGVQIVGDDSSDDDDDSEDSGDDKSGSSSSGASSDESEDEDEERAPPAKTCYGRILLVRATRTSLKILRAVDLDGIGSNFVPHVGLHPATYVNKILLGGRPARSIASSSPEDDGRNVNSNTGTMMLLVNVRSGKMIHSFRCISSSSVARETKKRIGEQGPSSSSSIVVTTLAQSPAVDTVAVGASDGSVRLVNTLHDVELFALRHGASGGNPVHPKGKTMANAVSSISFRTDGNATRQGVAPLAVGCDDGSISVWDLTPVEDEGYDDGTVVRRTLLTRIEGAHHGGVSRLEYLPGEPLLLSTGASSNSIVLHVFDAPDHSGRVLRQRRGHTSPPTLLRYLHPGLSGGGVLADASDGTDAASCQILSCGGPGDLSLRLFSTARSNLDREYSQGPGLDRLAKKYGKVGPEGRAELLLPEVAGLATSEARSRDWGDLVTIHRDHAMAYVWSTKRCSQSGPVLRQPGWNVSAMQRRPPRSAHATSLAISACGNFALVGTAGGAVYKYNLQSGLPRGSYPRDATSMMDEEERRRKKGLRFAGDVGRTMRMLDRTINKRGSAATPSDIDRAERDRLNSIEAESRREASIRRASHSGAVAGIAIDSLNKTVVTAGADSKLVLWNFVTHMPHKKSPIMLPGPALKMTHVRDSDLAAIALADFGAAVFDCSSLTIVRYFGGAGASAAPRSGPGRMGHTGPISDLQFGPDGRRLFTSSMDGTVRVWDVPTGLCVDWMSFSSPPTSLAPSPTGEFLATSHVGRLGISLWCDKSFFRTVLLDGTIPADPARMDEPCPVAECEREGADDAAANDGTLATMSKKEDDTVALGDSNDGETNDDGSPPQAKEDGLITLSGLPPAHWKNLFRLELVKERNKPTEAPKKPPAAPFFLQWRGGLESSSGGAAGEDTTAADQTGPGRGSADNDQTKDDADGWDAVWLDDDGEGNDEASEIQPGKHGQDEPTTQINNKNKRRKVVHHRSKLAELLRNCSDTKKTSASSMTEDETLYYYSDATFHLSKLGPSAIDVEISSLCHGTHDLEDGLPLLLAASEWLTEACESRASFEAVNAYLHRFLHVHGEVIAAIGDPLLEKEDATMAKDSSGNVGREEEENDARREMQLKEFVQTIALLREKQWGASNRLQGKMQHTLCLLRHLSRMV